MRITVKLFSYFSQYLPPAAADYAVDAEVADGARVRDVLEPMGVPLAKCRLIIINGIVHTRPEWDLDIALAPGDVLAVLPNVH